MRRKEIALVIDTQFTEGVFTGLGCLGLNERGRSPHGIGGNGYRRVNGGGGKDEQESGGGWSYHHIDIVS